MAKIPILVTFFNSGVQEGANDPFNQYYSYNTLQQLTAVDLKELDALGFEFEHSWHTNTWHATDDQRHAGQSKGE